MPSRRARLFGSLLALLVMVGLGSAPAQAAPPLTTPHARVLQFWTKDKIKNAKPRIMRLAASVVTAPPTSVPARRFSTGATVGSLGIDWTGGGAVQQTTGKVLFTLGTTVHVCTGSVATDSASDRALVVTAAHCAYDNATQTFATNWMFVPDYDSTPVALDRTGSFCANTRFGCWSATALVAHTNFTSQTAFTSQASMHDFAFAVLDAGGHNLTHVDAVVGSQPISLDPPRPGVAGARVRLPRAVPLPGHSAHHQFRRPGPRPPEPQPHLPPRQHDEGRGIRRTLVRPPGHRHGQRGDRLGRLVRLHRNERPARAGVQRSHGRPAGRRDQHVGHRRRPGGVSQP